MSLLLVTGKDSAAAPEAASRDAARARALAGQVDDLVVLEADESWWAPAPDRKSGAATSGAPPDRTLDARRSSLALAMKAAARRDPCTVVLLLDADITQVKRIDPLARKLGLPLLWWHEAPPTPTVVAESRTSIDGLLTAWTGQMAMPGWLWNAGTGLDLQSVPTIRAFPARPPLGLLAWLPSRDEEVRFLLRALALARGLGVDAHLTIALAEEAGVGRRLQAEAYVRDLALTRSAYLAGPDSRGRFEEILVGAHALVDVEESGDGLALTALSAMALGRPVLSSREQLASVLDAAALPLRFDPGDERQLAERMQTLAAAWSYELADAGRRVQEAVHDRHSAAHWADVVASIVRFYQRQHGTDDRPLAASAGPASEPRVEESDSSSLGPYSASSD